MSCKEKIFMDLEFDYSKEHSEILSIGAVKCDRKYNVLDEFYVITKPLKRKEISKAVKELTGLNEDIIEQQGIELSIALNELLNWVGEDSTRIFVWGNEDKRVFNRAITNLNAKNKYKPIYNKITNIQYSLCKKIFDTDRIFSLEKMKYLYNIEGKVKHEALSDALDLMNICKKHKTTKVDTERLIDIYNKEKNPDYYIKEFKLLIDYLDSNYSRELKFNTKNIDFQKYLANNFSESIEIPNHKGGANTIYLTSRDDSICIYYHYNDTNYCLKINKDSICSFKKFYCKLNESINDYFIETTTPHKINMNELSESKKDFFVRHELIDLKNCININLKDLHVSYVSLDYERKSIELLNDQKKRVITFSHSFDKEDATFIEMINKFSGANNMKSRCMNLNEDLLEIIKKSFDKNFVYLDKDKLELASIESFYSDIKELSKKNITFSAYGKANFHISKDNVIITKTKGDKDNIKLRLTDMNRDLLIEYLIDLAKTKKNKRLNVSKEFLLNESISLKCDNQRFFAIMKKILDNNYNKGRFSYRIIGDEIIISDNFTANNLSHINISLSKHCSEIFCLVLYNNFISRKYILDNSVYDMFKSIFAEYTRNKWLNSGIKTMQLTKNTKKILNKIYRENKFKKRLNYYKNINLISYEFNNSLFILLNNENINIRKKIHLKDKEKIEEFKEIFSELNIRSI